MAPGSSATGTWSKGTAGADPSSAPVTLGALRDEMSEFKTDFLREMKEELAGLVTKVVQDKLPSAVKAEVTAQLPAAVTAAVKPVLELAASLRKKYDEMGRHLEFMRDRRVRFGVTVEKAGATKESAQNYVNAELIALGFKALTNIVVYGPFQGKASNELGAATVPCWAVVGDMPSLNEARGILSAANRNILKTPAKGFTALGHETSLQERKDEATIRENAAFKRAAEEYERVTNRKPFFKYGKAYLGQDIWSVPRLLELEALSADTAA